MALRKLESPIASRFMNSSTALEMILAMPTGLFIMIQVCFRLTSFVVLIIFKHSGSRAVMNSTVFQHKDQLLLAAGGPEGLCQVYELSLAVKCDGDHRLNGPRNRSPNGVVNGDFRGRADSDNVRRRRTSSTSSIKEGIPEGGNEQNGARSRHPSQNGVVSNGHSNGRGRYAKEIEDVLPSVTFNIIPLKCVQTDFNQKPNDEPFQKVVRYSQASGLFFTGGADGHIRLWRYPNMDLVGDISAHTDEVDDLDIEPLGQKLVSISRDGHGYIWNAKTGSRICELEYVLPISKTSTKPIKYIFRGCR